MCKFNHIQIGETVKLSCDNVFCTNCNNRLSPLSDKLCKYGGHEELNGLTYDVFSYFSPEKCPTCSIESFKYGEICRDNPSIEICYKMELPIFIDKENALSSD